MHSKTTCIFFNVCRVTNWKTQSGMLVWYFGTLKALSLAIFVWVEEKHWTCHDIVYKSWEQPLCFPDIEVQGQDSLCPNWSLLLGIASPSSQHGGSPVYTGLASSEAQVDSSGTLLVYAIPTFSYQGSHTSQFSITEVFKRRPPTLSTQVWIFRVAKRPASQSVIIIILELQAAQISLYTTKGYNKNKQTPPHKTKKTTTVTAINFLIPLQWNRKGNMQLKFQNKQEKPHRNPKAKLSWMNMDQVLEQNVNF